MKLWIHWGFRLNYETWWIIQGVSRL
jgi:hypothetical protein